MSGPSKISHLIGYWNTWRYGRDAGLKWSGFDLPDGRESFYTPTRSSLNPISYTPPSGSDTANLQTIVQRDQNRAYNWSYLRPMRNSTANVMLYGVPYSEHRYVLLAQE